MPPGNAPARPLEDEPESLAGDMRSVGHYTAEWEPFGLLTREGLARGVLQMSVRELDRLRARDALPAPVYPGGGRSPRWSRATIARWIRRGCPDREHFEELEGEQGVRP